MSNRVDLLLNGDEQHPLVDLASEIADREPVPVVAGYEAPDRFLREVMRLLGRAGLLSLPYPEELGGGGQPYQLYLQVLEGISRRWASVAVDVSVHSLACCPAFAFGTDAERAAWLLGSLGGKLLGAYCLSEPQAGSEPAAIQTRAERLADGCYRVNGTKAWVAYGGQADFYNVFVRLGEGVACFLVRAGAPGLSFASPERKTGLTGSIIAGVRHDVDLEPGALNGTPRWSRPATASGRLRSRRLSCSVSGPDLQRAPHPLRPRLP